MQNSKKKPLVSVCCLTYNHAKFIRQCLDGFVSQKTNFDFEVLIHDDASTDGTDKIIKEYASEYPDIIKPLYEKENQYSKGSSISKTYNFPRVQGRYMAMCEGDDYWNDPYKLQKQVDFLEANPDYTVCFHKVKCIYDTFRRKETFVPSYEMLSKVKAFDYTNLLEFNFIQNCSIMVRWEAVENPAQVYPANILTGDWFLGLMFAKHGKIKFLDEVMAIYRINSGGVWFGAHIDQRNFSCKTACQRMKFYLDVYHLITENSPAYFLNKIMPIYKNTCELIWEEKQYARYFIYVFRYAFVLHLVLLKILIKTLYQKRDLIRFLG